METDRENSQLNDSGWIDLKTGAAGPQQQAHGANFKPLLSIELNSLLNQLKSIIISFIHWIEFN